MQQTIKNRENATRRPLVANNRMTIIFGIQPARLATQKRQRSKSSQAGEVNKMKFHLFDDHTEIQRYLNKRKQQPDSLSCFSLTHFGFETVRLQCSILKEREWKWQLRLEPRRGLRTGNWNLKLRLRLCDCIPSYFATLKNVMSGRRVVVLTVVAVCDDSWNCVLVPQVVKPIMRVRILQYSLAYSYTRLLTCSFWYLGWQRACANLRTEYGSGQWTWTWTWTWNWKWTWNRT